MDPIPNQHQEENIENITDPELDRLEGETIYLVSENVYNLKFDSIGLAAQLFNVSLRTFREDYIKGKNKKEIRLILVLENFKINESLCVDHSMN